MGKDGFRFNENKGWDMIRIFQDHQILSQMAAEAIVTLGLQSLDDRGKFELVLSGGSTPKEAYSILGQKFAHKRRLWENTHVYWADERCVVPDDSRSNFLTARQYFLDMVNIPADNIHRIHGETENMDVEAKCYEVEFPSRPDLLLLGVGADGHTASLFPHSPALEEEVRKFLPIRAPAEPSERITITPKGIAAAAEIMVIVSGSSKAQAVQQVFAENGTILETPARLVHNAIWLIDKEAAQKITKSILVET
jgi:6-phosphogluconolactonase